MKDWTIMVYMAGDNNLSEDMVTGLIGMETNLESVNNIALMAYYDTGAPNFPTVIVDFTSSKKKNNSNKNFQILTPPKPKITSLNEEKTSIFSITSFVRKCVNLHPAHNYALIFSGHGDGF